MWGSFFVSLSTSYENDKIKRIIPMTDMIRGVFYAAGDPNP
ncbi:hypothetical protein HMPREF1992_01658 [Selenomonas sp. oral taxon 892 str. F0426]|nr:hypothetical protein HMPREF1992_01658 [Selenomonas sp. oral taxon 892 str. F0426]